MSAANFMAIHLIVVETFHTEPQMSTSLWREREESQKSHYDSSSGDHEYRCNISGQSFQQPRCKIDGPTEPISRPTLPSTEPWLKIITSITPVLQFLQTL